MRAFRLAPSGGVHQVECAIPQPAPGEVLLRVKAVSLNFRDMMICSGTYPMPVKADLIPVSDGSGEIAAIGDGVEGIAVGDRVVGAFFPDWRDGPIAPALVRRALGASCDGLLADYALLPACGVMPFPAHLSFQEAATLPCAALTAWHALTGCGVGPGVRVLLQGTGGVSLFALQFAKWLGATVIHLSSSAEKLAKLSALGADETINYRAVPAWHEEVLRRTGGDGVDVVVDVAGGASLQQSLACVRMGGTVMAVGFVGGIAPIDPLPLMTGVARLQGILVGNQTMFATMTQAMETAGTRPVIDRVFPADAVAEAFSRLSNGAVGKVVIAFD